MAGVGKGGAVRRWIPGVEVSDSHDTFAAGLEVEWPGVGKGASGARRWIPGVAVPNSHGTSAVGWEVSIS